MQSVKGSFIHLLRDILLPNRVWTFQTWHLKWRRQNASLTCSSSYVELWLIWLYGTYGTSALAVSRSDEFKGTLGLTGSASADDRTAKQISKLILFIFAGFFFFVSHNLHTFSPVVKSSIFEIRFEIAFFTFHTELKMFCAIVLVSFNAHYISLSLVCSVTRKNSQMSIKVAQKWFHKKNIDFDTFTKIA